MKYVPIILSGITVVIGLNVALAIRDARMWDKIEQRNSQIEELLSNARIKGII
tara:strand:- start:973 stop:1131 length:159 start_codon:yes stop_codon:yes gene_type:complete